MLTVYNSNIKSLLVICSDVYKPEKGHKLSLFYMTVLMFRSITRHIYKLLV
jgi:hypothetical protein